MYLRFGKRTLDVIASTATLVVLSPFLLLLAIVIKIDDRGPALFVQERVGRNGKPFRLLKFRSMPIATREAASDELGSIEVTSVGKFIRRTNMDELPQLINVLRGDMSIVGPRPPIPSQQKLIDMRLANGALACRPGLTGLAQINAYDGMGVEEKAGYDGKYAANVTLLTDVKIILGTFAYLLKPPPVY